MLLYNHVYGAAVKGTTVIQSLIVPSVAQCVVTQRNNIHTSDCFDNIQIKLVKAHPFKFIFWVEHRK